MTQTTSGAWQADGPSHRACGVKSRWSGWEIGAMVAGFVVFWPVGLVALGVKLVRGEMWPGSAQGTKPWEAFKSSSTGWSEKAKAWQSYGHGGFGGHSGNSAFEDYKRRELERLENERRKLMEEQKAFREFVEQVKKAKDQEEFDRFMASRNAPPPPPASE